MIAPRLSNSNHPIGGTGTPNNATEVLSDSHHHRNTQDSWSYIVAIIVALVVFCVGVWRLTILIKRVSRNGLVEYARSQRRERNRPIWVDGVGYRTRQWMTEQQQLTRHGDDEHSQHQQQQQQQQQRQRHWWSKWLCWPFYGRRLQSESDLERERIRRILQQQLAAQVMIMADGNDATAIAAAAAAASSMIRQSHQLPVLSKAEINKRYPAMVLCNANLHLVKRASSVSSIRRASLSPSIVTARSQSLNESVHDGDAEEKTSSRMVGSTDRIEVAVSEPNDGQPSSIVPTNSTPIQVPQRVWLSRIQRLKFWNSRTSTSSDSELHFQRTDTMFSRQTTLAPLLQQDVVTASPLPNARLSASRASSSSSKRAICVCPICLDGVELGDTIRILSCKHVFHVHCIDDWVTMRVACCALCRHDLTSPG